MKKVLTTAFLLPVFLFFIFSCNSSSDQPIPSKPMSVTDIENMESQLPPGKQVLDDVKMPVENASEDNTMLGEEGSTAGTSFPNRISPQLLKEDQLSRRYKNLLVFHVDDTMEVNQPRLATLILSKDQVLQQIEEEVLDASNASDKRMTVDTTIEVGSSMRASLVDFGNGADRCFSIESMNGDATEQTLTDKRKKLFWQWKVIPLKPGKQQLKLSVQIKDPDGGSFFMPVRDISVVIYAKPESFLSKAGDFFGKNFQWMISAIMIPIIIAWFTTRMRNQTLK
ncbi:MAG: hypothetical protein JSU05_09925, partial [Bacteroidetes bacterium]|nr:hypothetical protein [Bacteroidota bacterium]